MEMVQAITWFRTEVLKNLLLESEEEILYWRGKEIAREENLSDYQRLQHFFLQNGLGILEFHWENDQKLTVGITNSLLTNHHEKASKSIALECGLITEMLKQMYHMGANGSAKWVVQAEQTPYIEVTVVLEHPRT